jgi:hypothetical protein
VLVRLGKIEGVERSYANHTGNMVRLAVAAKDNPAKVAEQALEVLKDEKRSPVRLTGNDLIEALGKEQWRESERVSELSAIEFRTLGLRRVRAFAEREKLNKETTDKLVRIAEEEWDRLAKQNAPGDAKQPVKVDWAARCRQFDDAVVNRARPILTTEQLELLKESFGRSAGSSRPRQGKHSSAQF